MKLQDGFKTLNDLKRAARVKLERVNYLQVVKRRSLLKEYFDNHMALILDVPASFYGDVIRRFLAACPSSNLFNFTSFVFKLDALNGGELHDWGQELMFVPDVEIVQGVNGIVRSAIRLYLGNEQFVEGAESRIYFSPYKRAFKRIAVGVDGEFREVGEQRWRAERECFDPCIVEGTLKIMDGVSDEKGEFIHALRSIAKVVLNDWIASHRIYLDSGLVQIRQRGNQPLNVQDVLVGPFNLEPRGLEIGHNYSHGEECADTEENQDALYVG